MCSYSLDWEKDYCNRFQIFYRVYWEKQGRWFEKLCKLHQTSLVMSQMLITNLRQSPAMEKVSEMCDNVTGQMTAQMKKLSYSRTSAIQHIYKWMPYACQSIALKSWCAVNQRKTKSGGEESGPLPKTWWKNLVMPADQNLPAYLETPTSGEVEWVVLYKMI